MAEEKARFRAERSTVDQLFTVRQLSEKYFEKNRTFYNNLIDFKQAFDIVWQEGLWQVGPTKELRNSRQADNTTRRYTIIHVYSKSMSAVKVDEELNKMARH